MKKFVFAVACASLLTTCAVEAAVYKGQREYQKRCKECHESGQEIAGTYKTKQWEDLMKDNGKGLADLHKQFPKAKEAMKYFSSRKYEKKARHLKDFLTEYAKDSGNVPACN